MAKLYFRCGAMKSGKTRDILTVWYNYRDNKREAVIMKPGKDTKADKNIQSRDGTELPVDILISLDDNIYDMISVSLKERQIDCILVDEAQFLSEAQVLSLRDVVDIYNIPVICYGLKSDFQMKAFPGSIALFVHADVIEKMRTICYTCNNGADYNVRFKNGEPIFDGEQVAIDGCDNITYEPMCSKCRRLLVRDYKNRK